MNLPVRFAFLLVFLVALLLHRPLPEPAWLQVDERSFVEFPLGFFGGDLNPHFFNYPTLHFYLCAALDYVWFLCPAPTLLPRSSLKVTSPAARCENPKAERWPPEQAIAFDTERIFRS